MYFKKQKRTLDDYQWEYYDKQTQLVDTPLRPLFLCLEFEATEKSYTLTAQLSAMKEELLANAPPRTHDRRLIPNRQSDSLTDDSGQIIPSRYEWLLYLQIPSKLKVHLHVPGTIKYRALKDDLVRYTRWKTKKTLLKQSMLPRMNEKPNQLITALSSDLHDKLRHVSERIENGDNQNTIMSNRAGKTTWRLQPTAEYPGLLICMLD